MTPSKSPKKPFPPLLKVILLAVIAFAILSYMRSTKPEAIVEKATQKSEIKQARNQYLNTMLNLRGVKISEISESKAEKAYCGSKLSGSYDVYMPAEYNTNTDTSPVISEQFNFILGAGGILPAIELGIINMGKGGIRKIESPSFLAFDSDGFHSKLIPKGSPVILELKLTEISPALPATRDKIFVSEIESKSEVDNKPSKIYRCGEKIMVKLKVFNSRLDELKPLSEFVFTIGRGEQPYWLENSVMNRKSGDRLRIIIPPQMFAFTLSGGTSASFPSDNKDVMIAELEIF
jgi:FKBP-type peptidyl-prolyl cis-trans isomerase